LGLFIGVNKIKAMAIFTHRPFRICE